MSVLSRLINADSDHVHCEGINCASSKGIIIRRQQIACTVSYHSYHTLQIVRFLAYGIVTSDIIKYITNKIHYKYSFK